MKLRILLPLLILLTVTTAFQMKKTDKKPSFGLVIHGGAGTILRKNMTPEKETAYQEKLIEVLQKGYEILENGGSALDAVEACIHIMEDSPLFNAGKGAVFTHEGKNELDASIMYGQDLKAGAVAGVTTVKHPISAARKVMENSPHVMMSGAGAEKFAESEGLEIVDPEYFKVDKRWEQLQRLLEKESDKQELDHDGDQGMTEEEKDYKYGTVGVAALDKSGNLAAGTSTGGMTNKRWGRIGDSPIIGAGTYADNETCAISATGHGEYFIRYAVAHDISSLMRYKNLSLDDAAHEVIMKKLVKAGGDGGVIGIDRDGNVTMTFNTPGMYRGFYLEGGQPETGIYEAKKAGH